MRQSLTVMVAGAVVASLLAGCSSKKGATQPEASPFRIAEPNPAYQKRIVRDITRKVNESKKEGDQLTHIVEMLCYYQRQPEYTVVNAQLPVLYEKTKTGLWPKTPYEAMAKKCPEVLAG